MTDHEHEVFAVAMGLPQVVGAMVVWVVMHRYYLLKQSHGDGALKYITNLESVDGGWCYLARMAFAWVTADCSNSRVASTSVSIVSCAVTRISTLLPRADTEE